ncbi:MAG: type II toxin-antitoxin system HicB family antitoxin [Oxalobacter formigenes]|nr:type II toxin-antitoxin system HicB family antitoxin [Oxalobacter formigenes]
MSEDVKKVSRVSPPYPFEAYSHVVGPLSEEDGGGFLFTIPDLPGCMSDGSTIEEAIENGRDAFYSVVSALSDMGREIPVPNLRPDSISIPDSSGKFVARVPKSLHAQMTARAKAEGVSLNSLVISFLAAGMAS